MEEIEWQSVKISFLPESLKVYNEMREPTGPFMVIESEAFFEAYSHVLKGMRIFNEDNLPMKEYIVE